MATGQTLLDTMEVLDQELQLQSGEAHAARGLVALNRAQDYFESLLAVVPDVQGSSHGTVTTSASTETTAYPAGLLRIDDLWLLDGNSRPSRRLSPVEDTGGHVLGASWPESIGYPSAVTGAPVAYWTNGRYIFWDPLPSGTHSVRWYGLQAAADITAVGTFQYEDICILPIAAFAAKLMKIGVDDSGSDMDSIAKQIYNPVIETLSAFKRSGAKGLIYRYSHDT